MNTIGNTIKRIRINKGYKQKYLIENEITQGAYSKIENKTLTITLKSMKHILKRLELTFEEFFFIQNGFNYDKRDEIFQRYVEVFSNNHFGIDELINDCKTFLKSHPNDQLIENILVILTGLKNLVETNDYDKAIKIVKPIWDELSNREELYLTDLYLLNGILFIFPLETALQIKKFAFRHIDKYKNFRTVSRLKINMNLNLSLLLMKNSNFQDALNLLLEIIPICKDRQMYLHLSICYIRKGICLINIGNSNGEKWINKGESILSSLDEIDLLKTVEKEVNNFTSMD